MIKGWACAHYMHVDSAIVRQDVDILSAVLYVIKTQESFRKSAVAACHAMG